MSSVQTIILVKMVCFSCGGGKQVTLYRKVYQDYDGISEDMMADLLNGIRRENPHIDSKDIWLESVVIRSMV